MGRRFGQHFLAKQSVLARIAEAACPNPDGVREPLVIEIGPGRGALTSHLLARAERVVAIEVDPVLVHYLQQKFREEPRLEVISGDILKADLSSYGPAVVAGNLPYYITSPILEKVFSMGAQWRRAVFLVQKEVAERVAAGPGSRDYGYLSVQAGLFARSELLFPVSAKSFHPPPKVESAVFRLEPVPSRIDDPAGFLKFASTCFRQKRKTLRNNLLGAYTKEQADALPESRKRAEQLSIAELIDIWKRLGPVATDQAGSTTADSNATSMHSTEPDWESRRQTD